MFLAPARTMGWCHKPEFPTVGGSPATHHNSCPGTLAKFFHSWSSPTESLLGTIRKRHCQVKLPLGDSSPPTSPPPQSSTSVVIDHCFLLTLRNFSGGAEHRAAWRTYSILWRAHTRVWVLARAKGREIPRALGRHCWCGALSLLFQRCWEWRGA